MLIDALEEKVRRACGWCDEVMHCSYCRESSAALSTLAARVRKSEAVIEAAREYVDPTRRSDDWRAVEWQDRMDAALAEYDAQETQP